MTDPITHARAGRCPVARAAALLLAGLPADRAQASLLRLGPNDWVLRAGIARRSERNGAAFGEREIAIERTLRWGDKPQQDQALADPTLGLRFAPERGGAERVLGLSVSQPFGAAVRDARVQAGSAALAAALANLLDNAQRHGAANVWIDVQADSTGAGVVLSVRDDGSGMAPAKRAALALALAQARDASPLGLGLRLADQAARAHGGRATLRLPDSPDARGCTICLQLGRPGTG